MLHHDYFVLRSALIFVRANYLSKDKEARHVFHIYSLIPVETPKLCLALFVNSIFAAHCCIHLHEGRLETRVEWNWGAVRDQKPSPISVHTTRFWIQVSTLWCVFVLFVASHKTLPVLLTDHNCADYSQSDYLLLPPAGAIFYL